MNGIVLIESKEVIGTLIDGYYLNNIAWFTRYQIGKALRYADPQKAIYKIHERHKERLDRFSVTVKLGATDGKLYDTILYNIRGVFEICRWSKQEVADMVMDKLYEMAEEVAEKGFYSTMTDEQLYELLGKRIKGNQEVVLREYERINPSTIKSVIPLSVMTERVVVKKTEPPVYPTI